MSSTALELCGKTVTSCIKLVGMASAPISMAADKAIDYHFSWDDLSDEVELMRQSVKNVDILMSKINAKNDEINMLMGNTSVAICSLKMLRTITDKCKLMLEVFDNRAGSRIAALSVRTNVSWYREQMQYYMSYMNNALANVHLEMSYKRLRINQINRIKDDVAKNSELEALMACQ